MSEVRFYKKSSFAQAVRDEIDSLFASAKASNTKLDDDGLIFAMLVLANVLEAIQKNGPTYLLRRADTRECQSANINYEMIDHDGNKLAFYFLETYGYVIVFMVNLSSYLATAFSLSKSNIKKADLLKSAANLATTA